jgi:hypothetical protein
MKWNESIKSNQIKSMIDEECKQTETV